MVILDIQLLNQSFSVRFTPEMLGKTMPSEDLKRKLTENLSADVVGYIFIVKRDRVVKK